MLDLELEVLRVRKIQLEIAKLVSENSFKIPIHLALGHESIAVSLIASLKKRDSLFCTHRNLHYQVACGKKLDEIIQYYKQADSNNSLGSMNFSDLQGPIIYSSSILGNNLPVATGYALSNKYRRLESAVFVVTGDGAIEEGTFYESLLFAKSQNLSIIYVIENNSWSLASNISERRAEIDLGMLCSSLKIDYHKFESNEVGDYSKNLAMFRKETLEKKSPIVVEVILTTLGGYFVDEPTSKRFVNYHAGSVKQLPDEVLYFSDDKSDPVSLYKNRIEDLSVF